MKRAVIVASGCFPPIINLWLETTKIWRDEVDVIYVAVDSCLDGTTRKLIKKFPKVKLMEYCSGWPQSYNDAIDAGDEELLLLVHDDTLIYEKGILDKYFKIAEQGYVVTPLHEIYSPKDVVEKLLQKKYPGKFPLKVKEDEGVLEGKEGYSFLLYFLFMRREDYFKTNRILGLDRLSLEQTRDLLDSSVEGISGDTGFLLGLEFFKLKIPIYPIPRYETVGLSHTEDPLEMLKEWRDKKEQIFEGGWFHLQNTGNTIPLWFTRDLDTMGSWEAKFHEVRLSWYLLMLRLGDFPQKYWKVYFEVLKRTNCDPNRLEEMCDIYMSLLFGKKKEAIV